MADTNPPQGSPGAPNGMPTGTPPNAVPKIELSQMMDVSKFQKDLSDIIMSSFAEAGDKVEGLLLPKSYKAKKIADLTEIDKKQMEVAKKFADAEMTFLKQVATKQRYNFEMLKQQKAAEYSQLQKAGMGEKQMSAFKMSAEKQLNIARMAAEKSEGKAGAAMGLQVAAASEYLTSMGAVLGVWEAILAVIMHTFEEQTKGAQAANALRSGGLFRGTAGAAKSEALGSKVFGGVGNYDAITQMKWVEELAKVPVSLHTTGHSIGSEMRQMVGTLGTEFGSVDEIVGTLGKAAEDTGMTMTQLKDAFLQTKSAANALEIDHKRQLNTQIQMRAALRGVTTDSGAATEMINSLVEPLKKIGASGVGAEVARLQLSFAKFAGGLSISKMTGMSAFATGGHIATDEEMDKIMANPAKLMSDYFTKLNALNPNSNMKYLFAEKAAAASGLQLGDARQVKAFAAYMDQLGRGETKEKTMVDLRKEFGYKDNTDLIVDGLANLASQRTIQDEVTTLMNKLMELLGTPLLGYMKSIQGTVDKFGNLMPHNPIPKIIKGEAEANVEADRRRKETGYVRGEH